MLMVKKSEEEDAGDGITSRLNVPRLSLLGQCIHFDADEGACRLLPRPFSKAGNRDRTSMADLGEWQYLGLSWVSGSSPALSSGLEIDNVGGTPTKDSSLCLIMFASYWYKPTLADDCLLNKA